MDSFHSLDNVKSKSVSVAFYRNWGVYNGHNGAMIEWTIVISIVGYPHHCCCMPSETYGRNGATSIFRSFHRTARSTTGGWSRCNILMCFKNIYNSEHYGLIFGPEGCHIIFTSFFLYISIIFYKDIVHVCYVFNDI